MKRRRGGQICKRESFLSSYSQGIKEGRESKGNDLDMNT